MLRCETKTVINILLYIIIDSLSRSSMFSRRNSGIIYITNNTAFNKNEIQTNFFKLTYYFFSLTLHPF